MLAILVYIVEAIRHALRKILRGARIIADSFREAQQIRRTIPRAYTDE